MTRPKKDNISEAHILGRKVYDKLNQFWEDLRQLKIVAMEQA